MGFDIMEAVRCMHMVLYLFDRQGAMPLVGGRDRAWDRR